MDNSPSPRQQIVEHINTANNVLVTVRNNPSIDQLAACIGLALLLNKMDKHATAVFSGAIPSTIEFLKPEETIEKTTDSLRDFIISLDKSKADKLRYKVEDKMVKIFITPYRTSITDKDLEFSQGDFNVDLVLAIGVEKKEELDQAITSHGRILHDATVVSINNLGNADLGSINWLDAKASSLCEMVVSIAESLKPELLDPQIATALLTGIVAETKRFSNEKTTSLTMSLSAKLMAAGAKQQLVANELKEDPPQNPPTPPNPKPRAPTPTPSTPVVPATETPPNPDGALRIDHEQKPKTPPPPSDDLPLEDLFSDKPKSLAQIKIDADGVLQRNDEPVGQSETPSSIKTEDGQAPKLVMQPPSFGSPLTANDHPEDPVNVPNELDEGQVASNKSPLLSHQPQPTSPPIDLPKPQEFVSRESPLMSDGTLSDLEKTVNSPHLNQDNLKDHVDDARNAVEEAVKTSDSQPLPPITALNANPVDLGKDQPVPSQPQFTMPTNLIPTTPPDDNTSSPLQSPKAPPPVPPPPFLPPEN